MGSSLGGKWARPWMCALVLLAATSCRSGTVGRLADLDSLELKVVSIGDEISVQIGYDNGDCAALGADFSGEVNGVPFPSVQRGGWREAMFFQQVCDRPGLTSGSGPWSDPVSVRVHDSSVLVEATFDGLVAQRSIELLEPVDHVLHAGDVARVAWTPSADTATGPAAVTFRGAPSWDLYAPLSDGIVTFVVPVDRFTQSGPGELSIWVGGGSTTAPTLLETTASSCQRASRCVGEPVGPRALPSPLVLDYAVSPRP